MDKINESVQRSSGLARAIAETSKHHLELEGRIMESRDEIRALADMNASDSEEISAPCEERSASMRELSATSTRLTSLA